MTTVRIAVASTPLTASLDEAVPAAVVAIEAAAGLGAQVVALPEACVPGHRLQARKVPAYDQSELDGAIAEVVAAAGRANLTAIVGSERVTSTGRELVAVVAGSDGRVLGVQAKTQIDPSEEDDYVPGSGRRTFDIEVAREEGRGRESRTAGASASASLRFAVAICHESFRYPEIARQAALAGAQVLFVPHHVTTGGGPLPREWCDAGSPYNEKALLCRALENTVFVAAANTAGLEQGSASCVIDPSGRLLTQVKYGAVGVAVADIDLDTATARLAQRWAPERNEATPV